MLIDVTPAQLATIVAALYAYELGDDERDDLEHLDREHEYATAFGAPLSGIEVVALAARLMYEAGRPENAEAIIQLRGTVTFADMCEDCMGTGRGGECYTCGGRGYFPYNAEG